MVGGLDSTRCHFLFLAFGWSENHTCVAAIIKEVHTRQPDTILKWSVVELGPSCWVDCCIDARAPTNRIGLWWEDQEHALLERRVSLYEWSECMHCLVMLKSMDYEAKKAGWEIVLQFEWRLFLETIVWKQDMFWECVGRKKIGSVTQVFALVRISLRQMKGVVQVHLAFLQICTYWQHARKASHTLLIKAVIKSNIFCDGPPVGVRVWKRGEEEERITNSFKLYQPLPPSESAFYKFWLTVLLENICFAGTV